MKYLFFLLLPAALMVTACGESNEVSEAANEVSEAAKDVGNDIGNAADRAADGVRNMGNDAANAAAGMTSINETVDAVRNAGGDITALSPSAAVANIDSWIAKLSDMDGTEEVTENLRELKDELTDGDIDGSKVGTLLNALGEDTRELAPNNAALAGLASALEAGGAKLGGM